MIYLDNAATTLHKPPCVTDAVVNAMQTMGNSGRSAHAESLAASRTIYAAREALAAISANRSVQSRPLRVRRVACPFATRHWMR
mgnify:CR=1 FL=1